MRSSQLFAAAALSATALAAPSIIKLRSDDVVLYGAGRYSIIKRTELTELEELRSNHTLPPAPAYLNATNGVDIPGPVNDTSKAARSLDKRAGPTIIIPNPDSRFLGWDVQMSQVVKGAPTGIDVSTGYSITNSISVGTSVGLTIVQDFLSASVNTDYSQSWASSQSQAFSGEVPAGKYGAFVSNPWTNRKSGSIFEGRIGSEGSLTTYQADSFDSKSFGDLQWVDGVISLCTGDTFPLPRCVGEGTL